jgi:hypothetical protein
MVAPAAQAQTTPASPPPTAGTTDTDIEYYHLDALGSVRMVSNRAGEVVARYDYLPFGEEIPRSMGGREQVLGYGGGNSIRRRFTGKERDLESGLDYFGADTCRGPTDDSRVRSRERRSGSDESAELEWLFLRTEQPDEVRRSRRAKPLDRRLIGAPIGAWGEAIRQINSGEYMTLGQSTHRILAAAGGGAVAGAVAGLSGPLGAPGRFGGLGGALGNVTEALLNGEKPTLKGALVSGLRCCWGKAGQAVGTATAEVVEAGSSTVRQLSAKAQRQTVEAITQPNPIRARTFDLLAKGTNKKIEVIAEKSLATGHAVTHALVVTTVEYVHKKLEREEAARHAQEEQKKSSGY